jgi:hypothetical protein
VGTSAGCSLAVGYCKSDGHGSANAAAILQPRVRRGPRVAVGGLAPLGIGELPIVGHVSASATGDPRAAEGDASAAVEAAGVRAERASSGGSTGEQSQEHGEEDEELCAAHGEPPVKDDCQ